MVDGILAEERKALGLDPRRIPDAEIVDRLLYALVNEGARILEEGIAQRASDIDVVYLMGYGFPVQRGGPMFHASRVGLRSVLRRMREFAANPHADPSFWKPAKLIVSLAAAGQSFDDVGQPRSGRVVKARSGKVSKPRSGKVSTPRSGKVSKKKGGRRG
jgi:3-hydroxyacyl-CoA dehydrogenase